MAFKCLLTVLAFSSGSANRRDALAALEGISSLLQKHAAVSDGEMENVKQILEKAQRAVEGITPGAQQAFSAALTGVITELDENVATLLRQGHADTQAALDSRLQTLQTTTDAALDAKMSADGEDGVWVACREEEQGRLQTVEAWETRVQRALKAEEAPCALKRQEANFRRSAEDSLTLTCDIRLKGHCDNNLIAFNDDADNAVVNLQDFYATEEAEFLAAQQACDDARAATAAARAELSTAMDAFDEQVSLCIQQDEQRDLSICSFGSSLNAKCEALTAFENLDRDVTGTGTEYSDSERRSEWKTTFITKCALQLLADAGTLVDLDFDEAQLANCAASVNYDKDVGVLNRQEKQFQSLTSEESFTCQETEIEFSGFTWNVPATEDISSSQYEKVEHTEPVDSSRSSRFAFCNEPNVVVQFFGSVRQTVKDLLGFGRRR